MREQRGQGLFELVAGSGTLRVEAIVSALFRRLGPAWFGTSRRPRLLVFDWGGRRAGGHGRRLARLHDTPCFGRPVKPPWAMRVWRSPGPDCQGMLGGAPIYHCYPDYTTSYIDYKKNIAIYCVGGGEMLPLES